MKGGQKGGIVEMFGWPYADVAQECEFLGKAGWMGVKVFPP
jgi:alpha-amylase